MIMGYEVIIIGCGPAGLSAAIYLGRAKVNTLLIGKSGQSQLAKAHKIENYFGFAQGISGRDLLNQGIQQAKKFSVNIIEKEVVQALTAEKGFSIKVETGEIHHTKALIIATGTPIRLSGIENEEKLTGKGVHYCVECDGPMYQGKKIAVIGNGNHAAEDALDLVIFTKDITIISNENGFSFSKK